MAQGRGSMTEREGKRILYIACLYCGNTLHVDRVQDKTFDSYNINWTVLQSRQARGGRGHGGFFAIPEEGKNIKEMLKDPKTKALAEKAIGRLKLIYETYQREGLL